LVVFEPLLASECCSQQISKTPSLNNSYSSADVVDSDFLIPIESQSTFFIDDSNATCSVVSDFSSVNLSEQTSEIKSSLNFDVSGMCIIFLLLLYLHSHFFYLDVISTNEECIAKLNAVAEYCLTAGIISPKSKSIQELLLLMLPEEFSAENQGE
jgi:hypothetical protein